VLLRRNLVILAVAAACVGCSSGSTADSAESVVRRHVEALDAGDFTGAMSLRCSGAHVDSDRKDQFLAEVDRLRTAAGGRLRIADIREVRPVRLLGDAGSPMEQEFEVRLQVAGATSGPLVIATETERGEPRVCGWTVPESFAVQVELDGVEVVPIAASVADVKAVVTEATSMLGVDVADDVASKGLGQGGVEGWTSGWQTGDYGGGRITVVRYASSDAAVQQAWDVIDLFAPDSVALFTVPSTPTGIGMRYRLSAWTGVQPGDLGPQIDVAVAVYDDVLVWITASALDPSDDHSEVRNIAAAVSGLITGP
jgi:hypothetical protein